LAVKMRETHKRKTGTGTDFEQERNEANKEKRKKRNSYISMTTHDFTQSRKIIKTLAYFN